MELSGLEPLTPSMPWKIPPKIAQDIKYLQAHIVQWFSRVSFLCQQGGMIAYNVPQAYQNGLTSMWLGMRSA